MAERHVEDYLVKRIKAAGGDVRKLGWLGRRHAPDRLILLPGRHLLAELKRPVGARSFTKATDGQLREHARLRAAGFEVVILSSREEIDTFMEGLTV